MEKKITLSKRLSAVRSFISGSGVVDVGTDHGYLPVFLAQEGFPGRLVASDINEGPLMSAKTTASAGEVSDKIEFYLTNGLDGIDHTGIDTVVLAGMGGETVISILAGHPWTKFGCDLILQPQSKIEELSLWLWENGYTIEDAKLVKDEGKFYTVFKVRGADSESSGLIGGFIHPALIERQDGLLGEYTLSLMKKYRNILSGLRKSKQGAEEAEVKNIEERLSLFTKLYEETQTWVK